MYSRTWEILESRHGRNDPDVGAACISLGNLAVIRRRLNEAIDWFRRALGTFEVNKIRPQSPFAEPVANGTWLNDFKDEEKLTEMCHGCLACTTAAGSGIVHHPSDRVELFILSDPTPYIVHRYSFRSSLSTPIQHHRMQECFRDGYTPVTASTAVALGNLLIKQGAAEAGTRTARDSQARKGKQYLRQQPISIEAQE